MRKFLTSPVVWMMSIAMLLIVAGVALAQAEPTAEDPSVTLKKLIEAIQSGHVRMIAAGVLTLLMTGWNWARKNVDFLSTKLSGDRAGAISVIALAVVGGFVAALASGMPMDFKMVMGALWTAVESAGIFTLITRILNPQE